MYSEISLLGIPCSSKIDLRCAMTVSDWVLGSFFTTGNLVSTVSVEEISAQGVPRFLGQKRNTHSNVKSLSFF